MKRPFSIVRRSDQRSRRGHDTSYDYLNRSARLEAFAIRSLVREWLRSYPSTHRAEWCSRFESGEDLDFYSSFWELYLYTYFKRLGFEIEVAPGSDGGAFKAPDFLLSRGELRFYLEATTAHGSAPDEPRIRRWKTDVRIALDKISSRDFFVTLDWEAKPSEQPACAGLQHRVRNWLSRLNYFDVRDAFYDDDQQVPELRLELGGGRIRLTPIPKSNRRLSESIVGVEGFGLSGVHAIPAIRRSLRAKSSRYGEMGLPYIVAINVLSTVAGDDEYVDALFGMPEVVIPVSGESHVRHGNDGAFGYSARPRATRVSAVLCTRTLSPWSLGQDLGVRVMRLIHHPWATRQLPRGVLGISEHMGRDDFSEMQDARIVLNIVADWPEVLPLRERMFQSTRRALNSLLPMC